MYVYLYVTRSQSDVRLSVRSHLSIRQAGGVDFVWGTVEASRNFDEGNVVLESKAFVLWVNDDLRDVQPLLIAVKRSRAILPHCVNSTGNFLVTNVTEKFRILRKMHSVN